MRAGSANLYHRFFGATFDELPPQVRAFHDSDEKRSWSGKAKVGGGTNLLARLVRFIMRLPPSAEQVDVTVTFTPDTTGELWTRNFGGRKFSSYQLCGTGRNQGFLLEKSGPVGVALEMEMRDGQLCINTRQWQLWFIPLPAFLRPYGDCFESDQNGRFHFDVTMKMPLVGLIATYNGWLEPSG